MCLRRIRGTICRFIRNLARRVSFNEAQPVVGGGHYFHSATQRGSSIWRWFLDAYSRRVIIGWDLGRTLQAELAIRALQMALNERNWKAEELIHHSDRGVQKNYASSDYTEILEQREIQISIRAGAAIHVATTHVRNDLCGRSKKRSVHGTDYQDLEKRTQSNR